VPFEADSAVAIAMKQVSQAPQRPSSINPQVSPALDAVVMRALEKEPGQRFQSADAFIAAIDAALKDPGGGAENTAAFAPLPPIVAVPEEPVAEGVDPDEGKRNRIWILIAIAVLIGLLAGFALTRDTTTEVPSVTGNQLNVAIALLQQDGFSVGDVKRVEREAPANEVLEQDPAAAPPADQASEDCSFLTFFCSKPKVTLTVSSGPGSAKVPSTAGLTSADAEEKLEEAGFKAKLESVHSKDVEEGLVLKSEPSGGETATKGSTVVLKVSSGPKLAKVPVVVGSQRSLAVQQIRGRGFVPSVEEVESKQPEGQVIRQAPSAGSQLPPGSTVSITVSKGEEKATAPNVIGKERAEAVEAVRAAGLKPVVQEQETEVPSQVGRVTDQFPPPSSEVKPGSTVTLVVGKAAAAAVEPEEEEP
jgi:serine/threonine-protein kinase